MSAAPANQEASVTFPRLVVTGTGEVRDADGNVIPQPDPTTEPAPRDTTEGETR